jgi:hypothetical protein
MWYLNLKRKTIISQHILHQHWYTFPVALPVRRNSQHRSLLTVVSATSSPPFQHLRLLKALERISRPSREPLYATDTSNVNRIHFFMNILCIGSYCLTKKTHNRTLLFGGTFKHCRHFHYCNQPVNMRKSVCCLDCHEAGLCCYLVIQIEDLFTSITEVLLPFVTCLLTLPLIFLVLSFRGRRLMHDFDFRDYSMQNVEGFRTFR